MLRRTTALSATLVLATAAAPLPLAHATSNATFTKKANAACAAAGAKVEALPKIAQANLVETFDKEAEILSSLVTKLDAIKPPSAKHAKYKAMLAETRKQITLARQTGAAVEKGQKAKAESLARQLLKAGDRSDALATSLKLSDCAKDYNPRGSRGSST
jgi:hypothetical protein